MTPTCAPSVHYSPWRDSNVHFNKCALKYVTTFIWLCNGIPESSLGEKSLPFSPYSKIVFLERGKIIKGLIIKSYRVQARLQELSCQDLWGCCVLTALSSSGRGTMPLRRLSFQPCYGRTSTGSQNCFPHKRTLDHFLKRENLILIWNQTNCFNKIM